MKNKVYVGCFCLSALAVGIALAQTTPTVAQSVAPLGQVLKSAVQGVENENFLALYAEGLASGSAASANLTTIADRWCTTFGAASSGCAAESTVLAPLVEQLQSDFAKVPSSQLSPATFTDTQPVTVSLVLAAQQSANGQTTPAPAPTGNVVGACYQIAGVNGPIGTMCSPAPGSATVPNGQIVSQGGVLYVSHVVRGLMGPSAFFEPISQ